MGRLWFATSASALLLLRMPGSGGERGLLRGIHRRNGSVRLDTGGPLRDRLLRELEAYFSGDLKRFRIPTAAVGTTFQRRVWETVSRIPYGATRSYGSVAREVGVPGGARAVGQANGANPVPLVVPCHRVTASDGGLGGYSSGVKHKRYLLEWERRNAEGRS